MINDTELSKGLLVVKILWLSMFAALAVYLFLGLYIFPYMQGTAQEISVDGNVLSILKPVLYVAAFASLIGSIYLKKFLLSSKRSPDRTANNSQPAILQKYTVAVIASLALSESIGIYGLVLFIIGKNSMDLYLLILVSAAAIFLNRPRIDEVKSLS